ncbi:hypothetical protein GIB67_042950 [Kingdonia uniflora]|uniref:No apical meristem-associated C-terminal domain-containing protein n=1 Tax=Kingdonia uniflora TaxID=39325 RepID=A0A7J7L5X3_9MAGN|nr:hypothetical protein GIB67_042950 [Kingdonia uniflora]
MSSVVNLMGVFADVGGLVEEVLLLEAAIFSGDVGMLSVTGDVKSVGEVVVEFPACDAKLLKVEVVAVEGEVRLLLQLVAAVCIKSDRNLILDAGSSLCKTSRGKAFMIEEDEQLCRSWLANYFDPPIAASNQKGTTFWARIRSHYDRHKTWEDERSENSLMHRWSAIQLTVNKFCGYVAQVEKKNQGEASEVDIIAEAKRMYSKSCRRPFTLSHCWSILHPNSKWQMYIQKHPMKFPDMSKPMMTPAPQTPTTFDSVNSETDDHDHIIVNGNPQENAATKKVDKQPQKKRDYEEIMKKLIEQNEKLVEIMARKEERALKREARRDDREQQMEDEWIMKVDTSDMNEMQKAYYGHRQAEIVARSMPACTNEG